MKCFVYIRDSLYANNVFKHGGVFRISHINFSYHSSSKLSHRVSNRMPQGRTDLEQEKHIYGMRDEGTIL